VGVELDVEVAAPGEDGNPVGRPDVERRDHRAEASDAGEVFAVGDLMAGSEVLDRRLVVEEAGPPEQCPKFSSPIGLSSRRPPTPGPTAGFDDRRVPVVVELAASAWLSPWNSC
jgi:hypothetical protein